MLKRIVLGLVLVAIIIGAVIVALNVYRHFADDDDPVPGIIFERTDRPARV